MNVETEDMPKKPEKVKFDPQKQYSWKPEDQFTMNGHEMNLIFNSLKMILNTPEAQNILLVERASLAADKVLKRAVENGIVQETIPGEVKEKGA